MTTPTSRPRSRPALSMNHLTDNSGGRVVDVLLGVTAFHGAGEALAGAVSSRKAFARIADGVAEIVAKVAPEVKLPIEVNGTIADAGDVKLDDVGLSIEEANFARLRINGYIETAAHLVATHAAGKNVPVTYRSHVGGDFVLVDGALLPFEVTSLEASRPGLGKAEMDAALARWADCLATLANIVNAEPIPLPEPVSDETPAE